MYETLQIMGYLPYQQVSRISEPSTISFSDLGTCIQFVVDDPRSISGIWAGAGVVGELPLGCQGNLEPVRNDAPDLTILRNGKLESWGT